MSIRLIALAATLSIAGLAAMSVAGATTPSSGGGSSGGGTSAGGGGGGHGGGGGGGGHSGGGGGHVGGGGGGHFGGGHFGGGGYRGGGFRGEAYTEGGYRTGGMSHGSHGSHANFMVHGGYISHGGSGYHVVGYETAGLAHVSTIARDSNASHFEFGPRTGSAATAVRMDGMAHVAHTGIARMARADRMLPHTGHPPGHPKRPHHVYAERSYATVRYLPNTWKRPIFCDFWLRTDEQNLGPPYYGCYGAVKAKLAAIRR